MFQPRQYSMLLSWNILIADVTVPITFVLPLRNQKALEHLIQHIYNPADQQHYGKYLTSEEFIEKFAPTQEDYDQVIAYAKKLGLNVIGTHPNRTLLNVSGPTKSIETAFNLNLNHVPASERSDILCS